MCANKHCGVNLAKQDMSWKQGVCYCLRVVRRNGGRGFSSRWFALSVLHPDFVYAGTFSTLLTTAEGDNTGFMALCAERMRRPSSWHPVWIQKVLHMVFICVGMCFRIGSKTTNIKKHLLLRCEDRACPCVFALLVSSVFPETFAHVEMAGCDFVTWGNAAACGPRSL